MKNVKNAPTTIIFTPRERSQKASSRVVVSIAIVTASP